MKWALVFVLMLGYQVAGAAPEPTAAEFYRSGKDHFEAGRLENALAAFESAYRKSKKPELLLNMAQCQRAMGRRRRAIELFESFLADAPTHALAGATRKTLEDLRAEEARVAAEAAPEVSAPLPRVVDLAPAAPEPVVPAVAVAAEEPSRTGLWVGLGVGGAVVVAGAVVAGVLLSRPAGPVVQGTVTLPPP